MSIILIFVFAFTYSQGSFNLNKLESDKIKFQLINNLIIVPVEVNGVTLSFLLDSGVNKPILFNIVNLSDSLQLNKVETVYLNGLGSEGTIEALKSTNNVVKVGEAINVNQEIYVIFDEAINFAPRLGIHIHGIIGYDLFKDFIVEINYASKFLKFYNPLSYRHKKCNRCRTYDLVLNNNKPYVDGMVKINSKTIPVKLLIDSGGSDALWLFEDQENGIFPIDERYFEDYLGKGLSGSVYGKRSKIESFSLQDFEFKNVNVAFPDSLSMSFARNYKDRNGSISGELLKRFNVIFDYGNLKLTLKKNKHFKAPFHYNNSGIVLEQDGIRLVKEDGKRIFNNYDNSSVIPTADTEPSYHYVIKPAFTIVELRKGSAAEKAGLFLGDIILSINNRDVSNLKLQDLNILFSGDDGKLIRMKIDRNGTAINYIFKLENPFK